MDLENQPQIGNPLARVLLLHSQTSSSHIVWPDSKDMENWGTYVTIILSCESNRSKIILVKLKWQTGWKNKVLSSLKLIFEANRCPKRLDAMSFLIEQGYKNPRNKKELSIEDLSKKLLLECCKTAWQQHTTRTDITKFNTLINWKYWW